MDFARAILQRLPGSWGIRRGMAWSVGEVTAAELAQIPCNATREGEERRIDRGINVRCDRNAAGTYAWRDGSGRFNVRGYGAIGDGAKHPLSERFATLAAAQAVYPRATALTEQIDRHAIQRTIDVAGSWVTVYVPDGFYWLDAQLQIGGAVVPGDPSLVQGMSLIGGGSGHATNEIDLPERGVTTFAWCGAADETMFLVEGPISSCAVEGIFFQCHPAGENQAGNALVINHSFKGHYRDIILANFKAIGLFLEAYTSPTDCAIGCNHNRFEGIYTGGSGIGSSATALLVGGDDFGSSPHLDVALNTFINCRFHTGLDATSTGLHLRFCDNNHFFGCYFAGGVTGGGIRRTMPTGSSPGPFPCGNSFFHCDFTPNEAGDTPSGGSVDIVFPAIIGDGGVMPVNNTVGIDSHGTLYWDRFHVISGDAGADPTWVASDIAVFEGSSAANALVHIFSANTLAGILAFTDPDGRATGAVIYQHGTDQMELKANGATRVTIDSSGRLILAGDTLRIVTEKTPSSASATGTEGDICVDDNFLYRCVATDTWKRAALSTW